MARRPSHWSIKTSTVVEEVQEVFVNKCTECQRQQLIFPSQVTSYDASAGGTVARYTCWCGAEQSWLAVPASQRRLVAA